MPMVIGFYGNLSAEDPMHDHEPRSSSGVAGAIPLAAYLFLVTRVGWLKSGMAMLSNGSALI